MFDQEFGRNWDDEPNEEEILRVVNDLKGLVITQFRLKQLPTGQIFIPHTLPYEQKDLSAELMYEAARLCLNGVIKTAKLLIPQRYMCHFTVLLVAWIPEPSK
ncbi:MAG: hypothetical protein ACI92I_000176 [Acidimicrobiales bacterium]|jgi:hypothetical protein